MIEKLNFPPYGTQDEWINKINELVDVVNTLVEENNIHERQIDELQMKLKTLQGAFIVRLDENDEPATATPLFKED